MAYIVIEKNGGWSSAVIVPDLKTGDNRVIKNIDDAIETVQGCMDGVILDLDNIDNNEATELLQKVITCFKSGMFVYSKNATEQDIKYFEKLKRKLKAYDH